MTIDFRWDRMTIDDRSSLLTGLPRSGTTLACALLNECPDTLALPEPIQLERHGDRHRAVREIEAFIVATRRQALTQREVVTAHVNGVIRDNFADPPDGGATLRPSRATRGVIRLDRRLSPAFHLVIKHPAEFSALADLLLERHPLVALVRHPLAVLAAWQTVDFPVNQGHLPMAETFHPGLAATLAAIPDRIQRQVALMGWLLRTYATFPVDRVVRYEDLVDTPATVLSRLSPHAQTLDRSLEAHDPAERYPRVALEPLAEELQAIRPEAERFYPDFVASLKPWLRK